MKTYLFSGELGLGAWRFEEILRIRGYVPSSGKCIENGVLQKGEEKCDIPYVDILYVEHFDDTSYDPRTYVIRCDWHSRHDAESVYPICRKDLLHASLHGSPFIAPTWHLDDFQYSGGVFILRPSHMLMCSGKDIKIINSPEELAEAREFYAAKRAEFSRHPKKHMQKYDVIASKYIEKPLLFSGRKFHLRLYGINLSTREGFWISRRHGKIFTAAAPFALRDFDNPSIHDTHISSTDRDYIFPEDFPDPSMVHYINNQLDELEPQIARLAAPRPYSQARRSFQVYGLDFMVEETGRLVLIELNGRPGTSAKNPEDAGIHRCFFEHGEWMASFILPPILRTYLFSGDSDYVWSDLREILRRHGYDPYPDGEYVKDGILQLKDGACGIKRVDFLYSSTRQGYGYDRNIYHIETDWHSIHDVNSRHSLVRKDQLHAALHDSPFIAETWNLDEFQYSGGIYILRPSNSLAFSGVDIKIVSTAEEFAAAKEFYQKKIAAHSKYHQRQIQYYRVIVSKYIENPLLFSGRKFHLRLYGINFSDRVGFWIARGCGEILTAASRFVLGDFSNPTIHDTHAGTSPEIYVYPQDFPQVGFISSINSQLDQLEKLLSPLTTPLPYQQAQRSFEIYGLDIMVREDGSIVLIEINDRPGLDMPNPQDEKMKLLALRRSEWLAGFLFGPTIKKTYLFSGDSDYVWSDLREILRRYGYFPYPDGEYVKDGILQLKSGDCGIERVDFLYSSARAGYGYDRNIYKIATDWHSIHELESRENLVRKDKLHAALHESGFIAATWDLEDFIYSGGVYILRPSNSLAFGGIDIKIITNAGELAAAKEFYEKKAEIYSGGTKSRNYYRVIVSKYIENPLLFSGRKFHLRLYGINFSDRVGFWIARIGKILTAVSPFVLSDFSNPHIHDTHGKTAPRDHLYPKDFPRPELLSGINSQLDQLEKLLTPLSSPTPYPQARRSFEIYGLDIMVREDGSIVLIEINAQPGLGAIDPNSDDMKTLFRMRSEWLAGFIFGKKN